MARALAMYAGGTTVLVVVAGLAMTLAFRGPGEARAIAISGVVAVSVQLASFAFAVGRPAKEALIGRGIGTLLRFVVIVVYAVLAAKVFMLPLAPALLSLAAFFFLTTLIEPLFLKR